jgi:hypothetical protein
MNAPDTKDNEDDLKDNQVTISLLEMKRIQKAVERSDTEKFHLFTRMMRIHFMLQNAVIIKKVTQ